MTKFKYKASWIATIEKYPYTSETSKTVVIGYDNLFNKTVSYHKETRSEKFCDTFEDAKAFLIAKHTNRIQDLEKDLAITKEDLERAEALTEDDVKDVR